LAAFLFGSTPVLQGILERLCRHLDGAINDMLEVMANAAGLMNLYLNVPEKVVDIKR